MKFRQLRALYPDLTPFDDETEVAVRDLGWRLCMALSTDDFAL